jgi:spore maturation protein CgeB
MKFVIFGLTVSSSWGNGHATLWRGLCKALARRGHTIIFFERDTPYYSAHRDLTELAGGELRVFSHWDEAVPAARRHLAEADVAIVTSYCQDGIQAADLAANSPGPLLVYYDMDTPVTLSCLQSGQSVDYIGPNGLVDFDLVLSYTGGRALAELRSRLGARRVAPLYGSVDPDVHHPVPPDEALRTDLSYLGTYARDRQTSLESLFIEPARLLPDQRFLIGGAQYPQEFPWTDNIFFVHHVEPSRHSAFYSSSRLTLNVTRQAMKDMGYCPSGRLFEAAACGVPIITDEWEGLDQFFCPGTEILMANSSADVVTALQRPESELRAIAARARERTLREHTAGCRAEELENLLEGLRSAGSEELPAALRSQPFAGTEVS